jgi:hypothetical protein
MDPYITLGVPKDASEIHIRTAYKVQSLKLHPDKAGVSSIAAFQRLNSAHQKALDNLKARQPTVEDASDCTSNNFEYAILKSTLRAQAKARLHTATLEKQRASSARVPKSPNSQNILKWLAGLSIKDTKASFTNPEINSTLSVTSKPGKLYDGYHNYPGLRPTSHREKLSGGLGDPSDYDQTPGFGSTAYASVPPHEPKINVLTVPHIGRRAARRAKRDDNVTAAPQALVQRTATTNDNSKAAQMLPQEYRAALRLEHKAQKDSQRIPNEWERAAAAVKRGHSIKSLYEGQFAIEKHTLRSHRHILNENRRSARLRDLKVLFLDLAPFRYGTTPEDIAWNEKYGTLLEERIRDSQLRLEERAREVLGFGTGGCRAIEGV